MFFVKNGNFPQRYLLTMNLPFLAEFNPTSNAVGKKKEIRASNLTYELIKKKSWNL